MDITKDECCICLEKNLSLRLEAKQFNCVRKSCCGSCYCITNCLTKYEKIKAETGKDYDCPICRTPRAKNSKEDFDRCMSHAKIGRGWALEMIGQYYSTGFGVSQSDTKAFEFYSLAAEKGEANAQHWLGQMYEYGKGVQQSLEKAFYFYSLAAEQGLSGSQFNVAVFYELGRGVEKSMGNAVKWFIRATDNGYEHAQFNLGDCYYTGNAVVKNYEKPVHYFILAAEQNNKNSQYFLALCYANGNGVKHSKVKSIYWLRQCLKDNKSDEIIAKAKAFVESLLEESQKECSACENRKANVYLSCGRCLSAHYCNKNCKIKHWNEGHKGECNKGPDVMAKMAKQDLEKIQKEKVIKLEREKELKQIKKLQSEAEKNSLIENKKGESTYNFFFFIAFAALLVVISFVFQL